MVSADRVSIKTVKHGAPGSGAGDDKESQSLGGWIRIAAMQGQTESLSVIPPSRPIISTNAVELWAHSFKYRPDKDLFVAPNFQV